MCHTCQVDGVQAEHRDELPEEGSNASNLQQAEAGGLSPTERASILAQLPEDTRPSAKAVADALGGADAQVGGRFTLDMTVSCSLQSSAKSCHHVAVLPCMLHPSSAVVFGLLICHVAGQLSMEVKHCVCNASACICDDVCSRQNLQRHTALRVLAYACQELLHALEEAAGAAGVRLKPLDKKAERAALQALRSALQAQLKQEEDPAAALSLAVPLLALQVCWFDLSLQDMNKTGGSASNRALLLVAVRNELKLSLELSAFAVSILFGLCPCMRAHE